MLFSTVQNSLRNWGYLYGKKRCSKDTNFEARSHMKNKNNKKKPLPPNFVFTRPIRLQINLFRLTRWPVESQVKYKRIVLDFGLQQNSGLFETTRRKNACTAFLVHALVVNTGSLSNGILGY